MQRFTLADGLMLWRSRTVYVLQSCVRGILTLAALGLVLTRHVGHAIFVVVLCWVMQQSWRWLRRRLA